MKRLFLFSLFIMVPIFAMAQGKYGFGCVVISKFSSDNKMVSQEIFIGKVINLDSTTCNQNGALERSMRKNRMYFKCIGEWFMRTIETTHPGSLNADSEITNMSQVERVPDHGEVDIKRTQKMFDEIDSLKVSEFMHRSVAEKRRSHLIDIASNDINSKLMIVD